MNDDRWDADEEDPEDLEDFLNVPDEIEAALQACGQNPEGTWCTLLGTEHCSFRCMFSDSLLRKDAP